MLTMGDDFADLVDPSDGTVLHAGPFAMHGGEWRVESVTVTESLIHIKAIATGAKFSSPNDQCRAPALRPGRSSRDSPQPALTEMLKAPAIAPSSAS